MSDLRSMMRDGRSCPTTTLNQAICLRESNTFCASAARTLNFRWMWLVLRSVSILGLKSGRCGQCIGAEGLSDMFCFESSPLENIQGRRGLRHQERTGETKDEVTLLSMISLGLRFSSSCATLEQALGHCIVEPLNRSYL